MRGGMVRAWRRQWAAFGRDADRNADCRGGVFAVFAKIPPPIPSPATHPIEASIPCGDSRMVMSAQRVFVATQRAASRLGAASLQSSISGIA